MRHRPTQTRHATVTSTRVFSGNGKQGNAVYNTHLQFIALEPDFRKILRQSYEFYKMYADLKTNSR